MKSGFELKNVSVVIAIAICSLIGIVTERAASSFVPCGANNGGGIVYSDYNRNGTKEASAKRFEFVPRTIAIKDDLIDVDLIAIPQ